MSSYLRRAITLLAAALLLAISVSGVALSGGATEPGRLRADLDRMAKLLDRELRPPAQRLARGLPADAEGLEALREPAATTQAQVAIALSELRQMGAATILDPHYLPALLAAGRAYVAVSGQDPLTATQINPGYRGLDAELADDAARLGRSAADAVQASGAVKRLTRALTATRRRARRLERQVERMRAGEASPARR